jgi:hypothetical protein
VSHASAEARRPAASGAEGWVRRIRWRPVIVLVVLFAITVVVARSCQQEQVRVSQATALATAREQIDFTPEQTQIRLVRQGLGSKPYWAVSFSIPRPSGNGYERITTVRVDANTGKVAAVNVEKAPGTDRRGGLERETP